MSVGLWVEEFAAPQMSAMRSVDRKGGLYLRYFPTGLDEHMAKYLNSAAAESVTDATAAIARIGQVLRVRPMPILYATLLRSESISSSWVEGLRETPRNIMVAQLGDHDPGLTGYQFERLGTARAILGNLKSVRTGIRSLRQEWTHGGIDDLHRIITPDVASGYRKIDVQIGGTSKVSADYVAPPAELVPSLMANLLDYANRSSDSPVTKAAIIHAQFETIHPYEDGNGRTGRVLVHGYLARAGLVDEGVMPLSVVLRRAPEQYVKHLMAFRHGDLAARSAAVSEFVGYFAQALTDSVVETEKVIAQAEAVEQDWADRTRRFRADSKIHEAVRVLVEQPVVTARFLAATLNTTAVTARTTIDNLLSVGVLEESGGRFKRSQVYQASALLNMMDQLVPGLQPTALPKPIWQSHRATPDTISSESSAVRPRQDSNLRPTD